MPREHIPPQLPYPLIDSDPHFARVVRYFRKSDYGAWAASTATLPIAYALWDRSDPAFARATIPQLKFTMKLCGVFGFLGGFLLAYQRSSLRFMGWSENKREEDMDFAELSQRAREGKPLYGVATNPDWVQAAAHRNSVGSQYKFALIPWFNLVNHPYHGVDTSKYYAGLSTQQKEGVQDSTK